MSDRSLNTSIWAPERNGDVQCFRRPGDWICPSCSFSNFQRRRGCFRCSFTTSAGPEAVIMRRNGYGSPDGGSTPQGMDQHNGEGGYNEVIPSDSRAHTASELAEDPTQHILIVKHERGGLSTSRWAPRNFSGKPKMPDSGEVWTRVVSGVSTMSNSSDNMSPVASSPLDLCLPYEVQHYILAMMQRILEEACYDFAFRWIPKTLNENNWTCSEAVELSSWRKVLPAAIPQNAIAAVKNYSLEDALADAVRIRNSAVHRHLCDNVEIRHMALQAQDLMSMFTDVTRQTKFHRLWAELNDWDTSYQHDPQASRIKLQEALQEISERPVDGMDWTPNAVSLQEITSSGEPLEQIEERYVDEMELD